MGKQTNDSTRENKGEIQKVWETVVAELQQKALPYCTWMQLPYTVTVNTAGNYLYTFQWGVQGQETSMLCEADTPLNR